MKSVTRQEAKLYITESGLTDSNNILAFSDISKKPTLVVPTEGKDALTVFDIARFICAHLANAGEILIWMEAREPFTQAEESLLFDSFIRSTGEKPSNTLFFSADELESLTVILALGLLYRWDFWVIAKSSGFIAHHSHDTGINIFTASREMLVAAQQLGLAKR